MHLFKTLQSHITSSTEKHKSCLVAAKMAMDAQEVTKQHVWQQRNSVVNSYHNKTDKTLQHNVRIFRNKKHERSVLK